MELIGFRTYNWKPDGYWAGIPDSAMFANQIDPQVLNRPGTYPTFGIGVVGPMYLPCEIGYNGVLDIEPAFLNFLKRLNPADITPGDLRALRNDGVAISLPAVLSLSGFNPNNEKNTLPITFVCCQPFWLASGYATGSGGFS
jgi:hypothetical protein